MRHWIFHNLRPYSSVPDKDDIIWEARYDNDLEKHKRTTRNISPEYIASDLTEVFDDLRSKQSEILWSLALGYNVISDPYLHGGGLHVMEPGGWLQAHLDYDLHPILSKKRRALNMIVCLNNKWQNNWGGAFILCDPSGNVVERIYPAPGRIIVFEVNDLSYHGVEKVTGPEERVTAAVYMLSDAGRNNTRTRALFMPNRGGMR